MRMMKKRLGRLEKVVHGDDKAITDVRRATDDQIEHYLRTCGINPDDEIALAAEAAR